MMSSDIQQIITMLTVVLITLSMVFVVLIAVLFYLKRKQKKAKEKKTEDTKKKNGEFSKDVKQNPEGYSKQSIFDFMEFDKIEDNMIVQKKGRRYLMVIECQGINFDLMSEVEKNSVEMAFWQFLNTLRHPIQLYVQTRTLNLEKSLNNYKTRFKEIENKYKNMARQRDMKIATGNFTEEELNKDLYDLTKQRNLYEYGKDIIENTERMSQNKNVLNKKYYIIVPYYNEEKGEMYDEEIRSLAFSELYSKSIAIIRSLAPTGVMGKILSSNELVELLYIAYNRDESSTYGLSKALEAKYDELYVTAPNVLDKRIEILNNEIEKQAINKINDKIKSINESKKEKEAEELMNRLEEHINEQILKVLERNKDYIGINTAEQAIQEFKEEIENKKEGGKLNEQEKEKTTRGRKKTTTRK